MEEQGNLASENGTQELESASQVGEQENAQEEITESSVDSQQNDESQEEEKVALSKKEYNEYKAGIGKMSQLEKERTEYAKKLETIEKQREFEQDIVKMNTDVNYRNQKFSEWRTNTKSFDEANKVHQELYGKPIPAEVVEQIYGGQVNGQRPLTKEDIVKTYEEYETQKKTTEQEQIAVAQAYLKAYPDADPSKVEDATERQRLIDAYMESYDYAKFLVSRNPNMNMFDAIVEAGKRNSYYIEKLSRKAQEDGELVGKANALSNGLGVSGGSFGNGAGNPKGGLTPTAEEQATIRELGLKGEEVNIFLKRQRGQI